MRCLYAIFHKFFASVPLYNYRNNITPKEKQKTELRKKSTSIAFFSKMSSSGTHLATSDEDDERAPMVSLVSDGDRQTERSDRQDQGLEIGNLGVERERHTLGFRKDASAELREEAPFCAFRPYASLQLRLGTYILTSSLRFLFYLHCLVGAS